MDAWEILKNCEGFEWDEGNSDKNWEKHQVRKGEAEQIFFNIPLIIADDLKHSEREKRFLALGMTNHERYLMIVFTIRKKKLIRVISARDMSKKERVIYEKENQKDS